MINESTHGDAPPLRSEASATAGLLTAPDFPAALVGPPVRHSLLRFNAGRRPQTPEFQMVVYWLRSCEAEVRTRTLPEAQTRIDRFTDSGVYLGCLLDALLRVQQLSGSVVSQLGISLMEIHAQIREVPVITAAALTRLAAMAGDPAPLLTTQAAGWFVLPPLWRGLGGLARPAGDVVAQERIWSSADRDEDNEMRFAQFVASWAACGPAEPMSTAFDHIALELPLR